jgi:hypothetical protein
MNKKYFTALATTVLLAISGVGVGEAQAVLPEPGPSFSPVGQPPLSPASQQNALRAAKQYLDMTAYSHDGLVKQLEYKGYTASQAEYGVTAAGL